MAALTLSTESPLRTSEGKVGPAKNGIGPVRWPGSAAQAVIVALSAIVIYLPTLRFGFVYDDDIQVLDNPAIGSWKYLAAYFLKPIAGFYPGFTSAHYYRPVFFLWLRLNYFLFQKQAWGWHLTNTLLHAIVCVLVLKVLRSYFSQSKWPFFGALLFVVHPAHVETVAWVSGCTDALLALGLFSSFYLWLKDNDSSSVLAKSCSMACFGVALFSKETAVIFPAIIFVHSLLMPPKGRGENNSSGPIRAVLQALPYAILTLTYLAIRHSVLRELPNEVTWIAPVQALLTVPALVQFYLFHLIVPQTLSPAYDFAVTTRTGDVRFWLPFLLLAAIAAAVALWYVKTRSKVLFAMPAWVLLPLIPVLYVVNFHRDDFVHDRYLYIPVLGISIAFVLFGEGFERSRIVVRKPYLPLAAASGLAALFALICVVQANPWRSNLLLYANAMHVAPKNVVARNNLASEYNGRGRYLEANEILKPLVEDRPDLWLANYNYGYSNYHLGNLVLAEEYLQRAIAIDPVNSDQYIYLGTTYFKEKRYFDATKQIQKAIERRPDGQGYHFAQGIVYLNTGQLVAAKQEMQLELHYHQDNTAARAQIQIIDKQIANAFR